LNHSNLYIHGDQIIGARDSQQDSFVALTNVCLENDEEASLLLVADGMGGCKGGSEASGLIVNAFEEVFSLAVGNIPDLFEEALLKSNDNIAKYIEQHHEFDGMGSTVVATLIIDNRLYWQSVGDSPLWLYRSNELIRLNKDHSMLPVLLKMAEMDEITEKEAYEDPKRHSLRSVIHGNNVKLIDSPKDPYLLEEGDFLILASDGMESLSTDQIRTVLDENETGTNESIVSKLLGLIVELNLSDQDNATVMVAKYNNSSFS
jgi:serine/threonine protein phosphatase PrpC